MKNITLTLPADEVAALVVKGPVSFWPDSGDWDDDDDVWIVGVAMRNFDDRTAYAVDSEHGETPGIYSEVARVHGPKRAKALAVVLNALRTQGKIKGGGGEEVVVVEPSEDLRDFGYAPGNYTIRCVDCPPHQDFIDQPLADKRAWRCEAHARAAMAAQRAHK